MSEFTITAKEALVWTEAWYGCNQAIDWLRSLPEDALLSLDFPELKDIWAAWWLYQAGRYWSDDRYTAAIAEALVKTGDVAGLYLAGRNWPDARYTPAIAEALVKTAHMYWLSRTLWDWPEKRRGDIRLSGFVP